MRQITLNVLESKFDVFMQIIRNIPFIKVSNKKKVTASLVKKRLFTVVQLKNKDFKFNRDEANER